MGQGPARSTGEPPGGTHPVPLSPFCRLAPARPSWRLDVSSPGNTLMLGRWRDDIHSSNRNSRNRTLCTVEAGKVGLQGPGCVCAILATPIVHMSPQGLERLLLGKPAGTTEHIIQGTDASTYISTTYDLYPEVDCNCKNCPSKSHMCECAGL